MRGVPLVSRERGTGEAGTVRQVRTGEDDDRTEMRMCWEMEAV